MQEATFIDYLIPAVIIIVGLAIVIHKKKQKKDGKTVGDRYFGWVKPIGKGKDKH